MAKNFLIMLNSLLQIQFKLYQKERFKIRSRSKSRNVSKKNNLEKNEEEILRVRYIPPELRHNY